MLEDLLLVVTGFSTAFLASWFIVLPILLYYAFRVLWDGHAVGQHFMKQNDILLEIVPPRNIEASPKNMEIFFNTLTAVDSNPNVIDKYADGKMNALFSFEIESRGGEVHFYVRMPGGFRDFVESALYAAYPNAQIVEADDYAQKMVPKVMPNKDYTMWAVDYKLLKHDAHPIRTYKKFEEDITGKMLDPLNTLIEHMSTLPPGQNMWLQYIIQPEKSAWAETVGRAEIDKFLGRKTTPEGSRFWKDLKDVFFGVFVAWSKPVEYSAWDGGGGGDDEQPLEFRLTPGEKQTLTALEENLSKAMFTVKMRVVIIGNRDGFTKANVSAMNGGTIKQFNDGLHNSIAPDGDTKTDADYVMKDEIGTRRMRQIMDRYRDRDPSGTMFHFSSEELATVFHLPDMSVVSPGVKFVDAQHGGAPANLPFMNQ